MIMVGLGTIIEGKNAVLSVIESGRAIMKDTVFKKGDIILLEPGEATSFEALDDTTTFVIKFPSVKDDKYLVEDSA